MQEPHAYKFLLISILLVAVVDIVMSACVGEVSILAQLIVQIVLHIVVTISLAGIYMRTVLIALPPTGFGITYVFIPNLIRLISLVVVRVLTFNLITDQRINLIFDLFNLFYWISTITTALELGKTKYYYIRYAFSA